MKRAVMIVLALLIAVAFVSTVFAQDKPAAAPDKPAAATDKPAKDDKAVKAEKPAKKADNKAFTGVITNVDAAAKTLTVKDARGEATLDVANATYAKGMKLEGLKKGQRVMVKFAEKDGKMTGMKIAKAPAKPKVEKKEEPKPEAKAEAKPEAKPEAKAEAKPEPKPAPGK